MAWTKLCDLSELKEGEGKYIQAAGHDLAVFLSRSQVHAMDNRCPHAGGAMSAGWIEAGCVVCAWHGWAFRLDSGEYADAPVVKLGVYPTRIVEGAVEADLPAAPTST